MPTLHSYTLLSGVDLNTQQGAEQPFLALLQLEDAYLVLEKVDCTPRHGSGVQLRAHIFHLRNDHHHSHNPKELLEDGELIFPPRAPGVVFRLSLHCGYSVVVVFDPDVIARILAARILHPHLRELACGSSDPLQLR
jgi:hypothetical protein